MDGDFQDIARLGTIDEDGAGNRIDLGKVHRRHIGDRAAAMIMPGTAIQAFEFQGRAGRNRFSRLERVVPAEMMMPAMNGVMAIIAHLLHKPRRN